MDETLSETPPQVSLGAPHPLEKDRSAVNQGQIDKFHELLDQTLVNLGIKDDLSRIFNFDETGLSGKKSMVNRK